MVSYFDAGQFRDVQRFRALRLLACIRLDTSHFRRLMRTAPPLNVVCVLRHRSRAGVFGRSCCGTRLSMRLRAICVFRNAAKLFTIVAKVVPKCSKLAPTDSGGICSHGASGGDFEPTTRQFSLTGGNLRLHRRPYTVAPDKNGIRVTWEPSASAIARMWVLRLDRNSVLYGTYRPSVSTRLPSEQEAKCLPLRHKTWFTVDAR